MHLFFDLNGFVVQFYFKNLNFRIRIDDILSGLDVELPLMPRTGHDVAVQVAVAERAAAMRTTISRCVKLSVHVIKRDIGSLDGNHLALPGPQFVSIRNFNKISHTLSVYFKH